MIVSRASVGGLRACPLHGARISGMRSLRGIASLAIGPQDSLMCAARALSLTSDHSSVPMPASKSEMEPTWLPLVKTVAACAFVCALALALSSLAPGTYVMFFRGSAPGGQEENPATNSASFAGTLVARCRRNSREEAHGRLDGGRGSGGRWSVGDAEVHGGPGGAHGPVSGGCPAHLEEEGMGGMGFFRAARTSAAEGRPPAPLLPRRSHMSMLIRKFGTATYALLWGIVFCETGLVVAPFLPGDSLLFAAGAFAAIGALNIWLLLGVFLSSAILGRYPSPLGRHACSPCPARCPPSPSEEGADSPPGRTSPPPSTLTGDAANYAIGKWLGRKALETPNRFINREHIEKTEKFYDKYGGKTVVLARFLPIVRTFAPFVAGVGSMVRAGSSSRCAHPPWRKAHSFPSNPRGRNHSRTPSLPSTTSSGRWSGCLASAAPASSSGASPGCRRTSPWWCSPSSGSAGCLSPTRSCRLGARPRGRRRRGASTSRGAAPRQAKQRRPQNGRDIGGSLGPTRSSYTFFILSATLRLMPRHNHAQRAASLHKSFFFPT